MIRRLMNYQITRTEEEEFIITIKGTYEQIGVIESCVKSMLDIYHNIPPALRNEIFGVVDDN